MRTQIKIPLPKSLAPYAAAILYHRFRSQDVPPRPGIFLHEVAAAAGLSPKEVIPWMPILLMGTVEDVVNFSEELGSKIGYETPTALVRGYMEHNGFYASSKESLDNTVYTLTLFVSEMGLFDYGDFDELKALVRRFYLGSPEEN